MGLFTSYNRKSPRSEPLSGKKKLLDDEAETADGSLFVPAASDSNCVLCAGPLQMPAVASCYHQFCHGCLVNAHATGLERCPECQTTIGEVRPLGASCNDPRYTRVVLLPRGTHAGITLERRDGPGVRVSAAVVHDQGYKCGVRVGDIVLSINDEVVNEPADGTRIINAETVPDLVFDTSPRGGRVALTVIPAEVESTSP